MAPEPTWTGDTETDMAMEREYVRQPVGRRQVYIPTPKEIAAGAQRIRDLKTERELREASAWMQPVPVNLSIAVDREAVLAAYASTRDTGWWND